MTAREASSEVRLGTVIRTCLLALALALLFAPAAIAASTFDVTRFDDPAPNGCAVGDCSLREAAIAANADADPSTINLPSGDYMLTRAGTGDDGDLDLTKRTDLFAPALTGATVNANGVVTGDRAFEVSAYVVMANLTVTGGSASADGDGVRRGGGIRVNAGATLIFSGDRVTNSYANGTAGAGGGIYVAGLLNSSNALITDNRADDGFGGGVYVAAGGSARVDFTVIRANGADFGGGTAGEGTLTLTHSRLRANSALDGGGAYVFGANEVRIDNSAINGNTATLKGGAIRVRDGSVRITSSTITQNAAPDAGGISAYDDGGGSPASVVLGNSILATNVDSDHADGGIHPDCADENGAPGGGLFITEGYNILGNKVGCDFFSPVTGDQFGTSVAAVDPLLDTPLFNGGPIIDLLTQQPLANSPAIDRANPAGFSSDLHSHYCQGADSRGLRRELGGRCDIGAVERVLCAGRVVNRIAELVPGAPGSLVAASGSNGDDGILNQFANASELSGGDGNDSLCGGDTSDRLQGEDGDDTLLAREGFDTVLGAAGNDRLSGGGSEDTLNGGPGNDRLVGGESDDTLIGGPGRDVCVGGPGTDTARGCEVKRSIP